MKTKNRFALTRKTKKLGYDWWWHSFIGRDEETGELKPFFIEYYVINPDRWKGEIVWGQNKQSKSANALPCYAMIKAGSWGKDKSQLHAFYPIPEFKASDKYLDCRMGSNVLTEELLSGEVQVSAGEVEMYPERMSDAGEMKWNLQVEKELSFDVGYGSSSLFNRINAFRMYWHVGGMRCKYQGEISYNNRKYIVEKDSSFGYQDKNWGQDYTSPWIWLNCNNFTHAETGQKADASMDIGGGCPIVFGIPLKRRILTAFYYQGEFIEFNFSKFWKKSSQIFNSWEDEQTVFLKVVSKNRNYKIEVDFSCRKEDMLLVNYESPDGEKRHNKLWNGGHAEGVVKLYRKHKGQYVFIEELRGSYGGCEYGEYDYI